MPNWCENHLYIEATESEIQNILESDSILIAAVMTITCRTTCKNVVYVPGI